MNNPDPQEEKNKKAEMAHSSPPKPPKEGKEERAPKAQKKIDPLEEAKALAKDWEKKHLYLTANFDNFRKRTEREKADLLKYGNERILRDLLLVQDNFERAIEHAKSLDSSKNTSIQQVVEGVEMIQTQFLDALKNHGLEKMSTLGETFDPSYHEAVEQKKTDKEEENKIIKEHQKGYLLNGRLLRAAKVTITKKK